MSEQPASTPATRRQADPLARFPSDVRAAFARFQTEGDLDSLDLVVIGVVRSFIPKQVAPAPDQPLVESARLMEDLGFDSLAIAETVFFLEDLFKVKISNEEIMQVRTVVELRAFIRQKIPASPAS